MGTRVMRRLLIAASVLVVALGCASDEVVYHPHFGPEDLKVAPKSSATPANVVPETSPPSAIVEKIGNVDYGSYGIPLYPGAKLNAKSNIAFKSGKSGARTIQVTLDSQDAPEVITRWYKDQVKAEHAYVMSDKTVGSLGTIEGTTRSGYPIKISVAKIDTDTVIDITVDDIPNK
jgi:hypothetical protein